MAKVINKNTYKDFMHLKNLNNILNKTSKSIKHHRVNIVKLNANFNKYCLKYILTNLCPQKLQRKEHFKQN